MANRKGSVQVSLRTVPALSNNDADSALSSLATQCGLHRLSEAVVGYELRDPMTQALFAAPRTMRPLGMEMDFAQRMNATIAWYDHNIGSNHTCLLSV
jgi:hypothetical protein